MKRAAIYIYGFLTGIVFAGAIASVFMTMARPIHREAMISATAVRSTGSQVVTVGPIADVMLQPIAVDYPDTTLFEVIGDLRRRGLDVDYSKIDTVFSGSPPILQLQAKLITP